MTSCSLRPAAVVFWLLVAGAAPAQEPPAAFRAEVEVSIVNIDVVVLDAEGRPVPGLSAEDFRILEDGAPVETVNLLAMQTAARSPSGSAAPPSDAAAPPPPAEPVSSVVVFVDTTASSVTQRNAVLREIGRVLERRLESGQARAMVASGDLGVRIDQPFTTDRAVLAQALDRVANQTGIGGLASAETNLLSRILEHPSVGGGGGEGSDSGTVDAKFQLEAARAAAQATCDRTRGFLKSIDAFVGSLGGVPGRKVLLWVGEGLQLRPGERLLQKWDSAYSGTVAGNPSFSAAGEASRLNLSGDFADLLRRANESRVHIVSIDSSRGGSGATPAERSAMEAIKTVEAATSQKIGREQTLAALGVATGGASLIAGELPTRLGDALSTVEGAYSLGFRDVHPGDGKYHRLSVSVTRPGLVVRHPEGYRDQSQDERSIQSCLAALYLGMLDNPLEISVVLKSSSRMEKGDYDVVLIAVIPIGALVLRPSGDAHQGDLALWLASRDEAGVVRQSSRQTAQVRVPTAQLFTALGQSAGYAFRLTLPAGTHRAAVTVLDIPGHVTSTATVSFSVGQGSPAENAS